MNYNAFEYIHVLILKCAFCSSGNGIMVVSHDPAVQHAGNYSQTVMIT